MNQKQRARAIGDIYDGLDAKAQEMAAKLIDAQPMHREGMWARIQGLLSARDTLDWAVKQVEKAEFERNL